MDASLAPNGQVYFNDGIMYTFYKSALFDADESLCFLGVDILNTGKFAP